MKKTKKTPKGPLKNKTVPKRRDEVTLVDNTEKDVECPHCLGVFSQEVNEEIDQIWVCCDVCQKWMHEECLPVGFSVEKDKPFNCPTCI